MSMKSKVYYFNGFKHVSNEHTKSMFERLTHNMLKVHEDYLKSLEGNVSGNECWKKYVEKITELHDNHIKVYRDYCDNFVEDINADPS